jgi:S1-C subfamily serine protease
MTMQLINQPIAQTLGLTDPTGFVVREIIEESPAWKAGVRQYDVVREINGVTLHDKGTVDRLIYEAKVGSALEVLYQRDGERTTATIVLEEAPQR